MASITSISETNFFGGHTTPHDSAAGKSHSPAQSPDTVLRRPHRVEYPRSIPEHESFEARTADLNKMTVTVSVRDAKARYPAVHMGKAAYEAWIKPNGEQLADSDKVCLSLAVHAHSQPTPHAPNPETSLLAVYHPSSGLETVKSPDPSQQLQQAIYPKLKHASALSRTMQSVGHRYYEYYHGAQETLGNPKGMGKVFPNLFSTSVGISMSAYGMLYVVQYTANLINLNRQAAKKLAKALPANQSAKSLPAPQNASATN